MSTMSTLSTQPFPSISENPKAFTTEATKEHQEKFNSLLDEPWKIKILPEPPPLPPGVLPAPDLHAVKSQPWRRGDVTRLKDDSPRGMMEYIATHTNGWWQELAERALRDNEKAERLVRESGWQPGQCWALEVDAEAKQKLLDAEEAKRQREEAERAKEAAEKEAFMQRQMELLKKAGRAPRCEYLYTDGRGCRAPQVKGERWCHGHAKAMSYRPEKLELELMEDEQAVMVNLYRVTKSLLAGRISEKTAGLMLWSVAIGMPGATRAGKAHRGGAETRRKGKSLPRIHADDRGSESKQLANSNWQLAERKTNSKTKTFEAQRNGGRRGGAKLGRELTRKSAGHSGVTRRKSFKSGVRQGSTPVIAEIARHRATSPSSEKRNHKEHEKSRRNNTAERHSSVSPGLRGEPSSSIRVHPRQSAVSSCRSSVSPCLSGEQRTSNHEARRGRQ